MLHLFRNKKAFSLTQASTFNFAKRLPNFINGEWKESKATSFYQVRNPTNQEIIAEAPQSTEAEFNEAVSAAKEAFKTWSQVPLLVRQRYMFAF